MDNLTKFMALVATLAGVALAGIGAYELGPGAMIGLGAFLIVVGVGIMFPKNRP